jgi:4-alpha-glucanotransferase
VTLVGDLPFVPRHDSPEVWSRAGEFRLDLSAGVPPDAFSKAGQDWGLPTYRWDVVAASGFAWMRRRAERMAALFDGLRVDHVIGLYRTYARPRSGAAYFIPSDEAAQRAQGEAVLAILKERGIDIVVEDLGLIPEFVRSSLRAMGIPGCRVIRWERHWQAKGQPYIDPEGYPAVSAAMTGTHDTEPMAVWWDDLGADDREAFLALPVFARHDIAGPGQPWSDALRDAILELACRAGSDRLFLPIQDLFGWRARINTPGTVTAGNWTWCVPWPVDRMDAIEIARDRARFLRELCASSGRIGRPDYTRSARPGAGA